MKIYKSLCPAKINLFLKVVGKRSDGFHELESFFAFTDLFDELSVEVSDNFSLEISGEFARFVDQRNNLFVKILDFFSREFDVPKNLKIKIVKNIPVGSGGLPSQPTEEEEATTMAVTATMQQITLLLSDTLRALLLRSC